MAKQIHLVAAAALALAVQASAIAQISLAPTTAAQDVQRLAPQLVTFAGSDANFQNLVNGLSRGAPVILITTADGFLQTVSFTPAGGMSSVDIARTLETARQQLIGRGVANPTAQQIGVTLAGGSLPTPAGTTQVSAVVNTVVPGGLQPSASAGASVRTPPAPIGSTSPAGNLVVDIRPTSALPLGTTPATTTGTTPGTTLGTTPGTTLGTTPGTTLGTTPGTTPGVTISGNPGATATIGASPGTTPSVVPQPTGLVRFTSDSGRNSNTSDTPLPSSAATPVTVNPSTGVSNGGPSPAAQMQGRR